MARRVLPLLAALALLAPAELHADPRVDAVFADDGVTITDGGKSVLFYRTAPADPREPGRLNYVHPIWAPDGTVLTEDRPPTTCTSAGRSGAGTRCWSTARTSPTAGS
jgi:hypothetical protein